MGNRSSKNNEVPRSRPPSAAAPPPLRSSMSATRLTQQHETDSADSHSSRIQAPHHRRTTNAAPVNMYSGRQAGSRRRPPPQSRSAVPRFSISFSPSQSLERLLRPKQRKKQVTFFDFKGLMAPVFTCFKDDETNSLDLENIDKYAHWLKSQHINGVLVNSYTGEGSALGLEERKRNTEAWHDAATHHDLILMVQIGGAPLPDVIHLAEHAEQLGVHAVLCLPELFYTPRDISQLVGYCRIVAKHCNTRPFFYYHIPRITEVYFDMEEFCQKAEDVIPNFFGVQYSSTDLEMGERCLRRGRCVLLGSSALLASGMLLGFESGLMTVLNIRPDLGRDIYKAMINNDMANAKEKQAMLNNLIRYNSKMIPHLGFVGSMKHWFNRESRYHEGPGFSVGPHRVFFEAFETSF